MVLLLTVYRLRLNGRKVLICKRGFLIGGVAMCFFTNAYMVFGTLVHLKEFSFAARGFTSQINRIVCALVRFMW